MFNHSKICYDVYIVSAWVYDLYKISAKQMPGIDKLITINSIFTHFSQLIFIVLYPVVFLFKLLTE